MIELHISNVHAREEFRHHSFISPVARGIIVGFGVLGYSLAIKGLLRSCAERGPTEAEPVSRRASGSRSPAPA